jgi:hypothetical protein
MKIQIVLLAMAYYNWTSGTYFLNGETAVAGNQIIIS